MLLFRLLYWVTLIGALATLLIGVVLLCRLFHRTFKRLWFLFPFLLVPPLFLLVRHPQPASVVWRMLALLCGTMMVWSLMNGACALWAWARGDKDAPSEDHARQTEDAGGDDFDQDSRSAVFLSWEEALQIVMALEERRWGLGLSIEWLVTQCQGVPILLEALEHLRARGHVGDKIESHYSTFGHARKNAGAQEDTSDRSVGASTYGAHLSPHELLGVDPSATREQIKVAYREQMKRYHPDRLQQFGPEFALLATEKTKLIQRAYQSLIESAEG